MSGWLFLAIVSLIAVGVFLNGRRFSRMTKNPFAHLVRGFDMPLAQIQNLGRVQMLLAPFVWLLFALMIFGFFGPVEGIQTIQF